MCRDAYKEEETYKISLKIKLHFKMHQGEKERKAKLALDTYVT